MNVRAQAVGMASQAQNVANLIFQQCFPQFLKKAGWKTFFFFAGINLLLALFVWVRISIPHVINVLYGLIQSTLQLCIPETKKGELEEVDTLFGGSNHKEKGAELVEHDPERLGSIDLNKTSARSEIREA